MTPSSCCFSTGHAQRPGTSAACPDLAREAQSRAPTPAAASQTLGAQYLHEHGAAANALPAEPLPDARTLHHVATAVLQPLHPFLKYPDFQPVICRLEAG